MQMRMTKKVNMQISDFIGVWRGSVYALAFLFFKTPFVKKKPGAKSKDVFQLL